MIFFLSKLISVMFFSYQGTDLETLVQHSSELCIPKHLACHSDLAPFSDLMKWLKEVDQTVFLELCQVCLTFCFSI